MATVILRLPQVRARTGLSRSQLYELISRGRFPRQVKLSERAAGWVEDQVEAWLAARISASRLPVAA